MNKHINRGDIPPIVSPFEACYSLMDCIIFALSGAIITSALWIFFWLVRA